MVGNHWLLSSQVELFLPDFLQMPQLKYKWIYLESKWMNIFEQKKLKRFKLRHRRQLIGPMRIFHVAATHGWISWPTIQKVHIFRWHPTILSRYFSKFTHTIFKKLISEYLQKLLICSILYALNMLNFSLDQALISMNRAMAFFPFVESN